MFSRKAIPIIQKSAVDIDRSAVEVRKAAVLGMHSWIARITEGALALAQSKKTHRQKYLAFRALTDRIEKAVGSQTPCQRGCSSCCHITVQLSGWEATQIAREIGQPLRNTAPTNNDSEWLQMSSEEFRSEVNAAIDASFGRPCGFLKGGACSIYASRPIACRLHHSLNDTAAMCSTSVRPEDSAVPRFSFDGVWMAYALCSFGTGFGDIGEFFDAAGRVGASGPDNLSGQSHDV